MRLTNFIFILLVLPGCWKTKPSIGSRFCSLAPASRLFINPIGHSVLVDDVRNEIIIVKMFTEHAGHDVFAPPTQKSFRNQTSSEEMSFEKFSKFLEVNGYSEKNCLALASDAAAFAEKMANASSAGP